MELLSVFLVISFTLSRKPWSVQLHINEGNNFLMCLYNYLFRYQYHDNWALAEGNLESKNLLSHHKNQSIRRKLSE